MNTRSIEEYLQLPYTIEIIRETLPENPGWIARVVELPGCLTQADNFEELEAMLLDAMRLWLEVAIEDHLPIPEPQPSETHSGKFVVRVPRSLHRQLAETAIREGVSLNAYCNYALSRSISANREVAEEVNSAENSATEYWPGLSTGARHVLRAAGYQAEAGQADERLLADWIENYIEQAQTAVQNGSTGEALLYLNNLQEYLHLFMDLSPILQVYSKMVQFLIAQVEENHNRNQGNITRKKVEAMISSLHPKSREIRESPSELSRDYQLVQDLFSEEMTEENHKLILDFKQRPTRR